MRRRGFTLIELLVALTILVSAFAVVFSIFGGAVSAWRRSQDALNDLHHGDFVMEQLVQALRSTVYFDSRPELYTFRHESRSRGGQPADLISWVTSSSAFMPLDSPYANGLHRLIVTVDRAAYNQYGVAVRAMSPMSEEEDESTDPWFVSTRVVGLRCRIFDDELGQWQSTWEETNAIPSMVEITLYIAQEDEFAPPVRMQRAVQIPIAPLVTSRVDFVEGDF